MCPYMQRNAIQVHAWLISMQYKQHRRYQEPVVPEPHNSSWYMGLCR